MNKTTIPESASPLVKDVVALFRELLHALLTASVPDWLDIQLTLPQLRALFIVAHNQTSSVMQIARHLKIGEPTASHLVDKLMQAGLVSRGIDPQDRRRAIIQLSPEGKEIIEKVLGWEEFLKERLDKVPERKLALLCDGLIAIMPQRKNRP